MATRCFYELMSALIVPALVDDIEHLMYSHVFIFLHDKRQSQIKFDAVHIYVFYYHLLFSVVVYHHGKKATGGHYTTAVFHPAINNWIIIDDSLVKHVSVGTVLKNVPGRVPYLLYYRRIDMH